MQKPGMGLILGAAALLAGCTGSNTTSNPSTNPTQTTNLAITTTALPAGTVGAAYSSPVAAAGGTTPYTFSAANLPGGLAINSATGAITGTPGSAGTSSATIKVTDSTQPSSQSTTSSLSITINPAASAPPAPLAVTTTSLPGGTAATAYPATTLQASGGVPPYTWAL